MSDEMIAMEHELRRRADEITSLRADMKILGDSNYELCEKIDRLRAEVERQENTIKVLRATISNFEYLLAEAANSFSGIVITDEQIDKAWAAWEGNTWVKTAARAFGIVECPECHGRERGVMAPGGKDGWITCPRCHGHRWIRQERGDE